SGPAATTGVAYTALTACAAATSRRNRAAYEGSRARWGWMTLTATARPAGEKPRYTRPIPPAPSRDCSLKSPIIRGSSAVSASKVTPRDRSFTESLAPTCWSPSAFAAYCAVLRAAKPANQPIRDRFGYIQVPAGKGCGLSGARRFGLERQAVATPCGQEPRGPGQAH